MPNRKPYTYVRLILHEGEVEMNAWQGFALGFLAGSLFVIFILPWLQNRLNHDQQ